MNIVVCNVTMKKNGVAVEAFMRSADDCQRIIGIIEKIKRKFEKGGRRIDATIAIEDKRR